MTRAAVLLVLLASQLGTAALPLEVTVAVQNEVASLPSAERLFTRVNPGAEAGLGWRWLRSGRLDVLQSVVAGVWHHGGFATSLTARTTAGVRVRLIGQLTLGAGVTLGALAHAIEAPVFTRSGTTFSEGPALLTRFVGGLVLDAAWSFGRLTPFLSYGLLVETPFLLKFSPVFPHQTLQVGLRLALGDAP